MFHEIINPNYMTKPLSHQKSKRNLRCNFTDAELLVVGKELAEGAQELAQLESDKKRVTQDFSAKISAVESRISLAANKISTRYEFRMVTCTELLGRPEPHLKMVHRDDTDEFVAQEEMTEKDLQRELDLKRDA